MTVRYLLLCGMLLLPQFGAGQCPPAYELVNRVRAINQRPFSEQYQPLLAWQQQWDRCRFPADSIYVGTLLQLGQHYHANNNLPQAVRVVRRAVVLCQKNAGITRVADQAKAWYRLGVLYTYQNQITQATNALRQAVSVGMNDPASTNWVGNAHLYLAYAYETLGDFQQTLAQAELGIPMAMRLANKPLAANLLRQQAQAFNTLQKYDAAQKAIEQAIELIKQQKELKQALIDDYSLLSLILENKQQHGPALKYAQLSVTLSQQLHYDETPTLAIRLGFLYAKTGDYEQAIRYYQYGIDQSTDAFVKAVGLNMMGLAYRQKRQFAKALSFYQQGMQVLPIVFTKQPARYNPTQDQIRLVERKGILLTLLQDKADTWLAYAKATNNRQHLQYALETYQVADQMIDFMRWEHTGQQSKLYWRDKTRPMYERAIETCYRLGNTEQAFRFFEKSRAVMLADKLNEMGARMQLAPNQAKDEQRLRQTLTEQQTRLAGLTPDSTDYAPARTSLLLKQDSLETFLKHLEATNPAYYRYKYDNATPVLTDIQQYLANRQASFLAYFVGDSALYVLGITGTKTTLIRQPVGSYRQTVREFMPMLAKPDAMSRVVEVRRFSALGNTLYRQLIAPLELADGRVIVSPDGSFVPFETLSRSSQKPDFLVSQYAFSYAYSAGLLLKKGDKKPYLTRFGSYDFLGVAPVSFSPRLEQASLAGSDLALKSIADRFDAPVLLTHQAATRRAFLEAAPAYRFIQLFTHATADSTAQEPQLFFADSTLKLSDLADGALPNAQMVVLTACRTGIGVNQQGEGVFSLARGFAALGVPSMLTTLWSVEDRATYSLTQLFYQHLDEGLPKDLALQRAKQDWLSTADGASQLPNVWAGLILVGNTEPLDRTSSLPGLAAGGLILTGAGALVWWIRRKRRVAKPVTSWLRPA